MPYEERKKRQWAKQDANERAAALSALLETRNGRKLIWHLLGETRAIGLNPFTSNALTTAFQCGEQNIGQKLLAMVLDVKPEAFIMMQQESKDESDGRERVIAKRDAENREPDPGGYRDAEDGNDGED